MEQEHRQRISGWMGWAMIITAIFIDLFEALLGILIIGEFVNPVIAVAADVGFWIWFKILGVSFTKNPKNFATMFTQAIVGFIPILNILPELTLGVIVLVKLTQSEDKGGLLGKVAHTAAPVMQRRMQAGYQRQIDSMERLHPNTLNLRSQTQPKANLTPKFAAQNKSQNISPKTESESKSPKQEPRMAPTLANDQNYQGYKTPDWMRDKSVDEALEMRKKRAEVAERMGYDKEKTAREVLRAEKEDDERKHRAYQLR